MVTFSPGRLPAGPNKGKTQTAAQASEVFRLCKHQARAAGGSRAPRAWAEGSQQAEHRAPLGQVHRGGRVRCTARGWAGASRLVLGAADLAA